MTIPFKVMPTVRVNLDSGLSQRWLGLAHGLGKWFIIAHGIVPWYCM